MNRTATVNIKSAISMGLRADITFDDYSLTGKHVVFRLHPTVGADSVLSVEETDSEITVASSSLIELRIVSTNTEWAALTNRQYYFAMDIGPAASEPDYRIQGILSLMPDEGAVTDSGVSEIDVSVADAEIAVTMVGGVIMEDHASSHQSGGADAIKLDDLSDPDDNTDLNASTSKHGLLPKLGGGSTDFLRADGSWEAPPDSSNAEDSTAAGQLLFGDGAGGYDHTETSELKWDDTNKQIIINQLDTPLKPALAFGDGSSGFYGTLNNRILISLGGILHWGFIGGSKLFQGADTDSPALKNVASSGTAPNIFPSSGDQDTGVGRVAADQISIIAGGVEGIRITETGSAITAETFGDILGNVRKKITVSTATYTLNESDNYPEIIIHVTRTASGTCTITIDTDQLANDSQITFKDAAGGASSFNIVIDTEGAETIDGAASLTISADYGSKTLYNDGSNWFTK